VGRLLVRAPLSWWNRLLGRIQSTAFRIRTSLSWLLGSREIERTATDAITGLGQGSAHAAAAIAWDGLPSEPQALAFETNKRLRELLMMIARVENDYRTAINHVRTDLDLGLASEARERAAAVLELATHGVKTAIHGLLVVFIGIAVQTIAVIWLVLEVERG
jgi:hypothetical protein